MKKICIILFVLTCYVMQAQVNAPWMEQLRNSRSKSAESTPLTYQEINDSFNRYWVKRDHEAKGSGYKPGMRWGEYKKNSVQPDGTLPTPQFMWDQWASKKKMAPKNRSNANFNWTPMGPFDHNPGNSWSPGQGRVNVVAIDPNNDNIIYVGAPAGGIWKSTNSGSTWTPLIDDLPQIGVSGIAIDPKNSNIIYISTGDDDASDSYSIGVLKSTDGGTTWAKTGLVFNNTYTTSNDIYIDPNNSNTLWIATSVGLYKTTNAGTSWRRTLNGNIKDIKLKPGDSNTIYAVTSSSFYKSTDAGNSFSQVRSGLPSSSGRFVIDVTSANPQYVYVLSANTRNNDYSFQGIYKSTNSGASFTKTRETSDIFQSGQAWYDLAFAVSDKDPNTLFVGVLDIWKSTDGGNDFSRINKWDRPRQASYTHADIHFLRYHKGRLLCGSDGGVFISNNDGNSFTDYTKGLQIGQFYRISVAANASSTNLVGGLQDNGGYGLKNSTWYNYHGADGMDCAVSGNNPNTYYGFIQGGASLYRTTDRGANQNYVTRGPEGGNWVTPLVSDSNGNLYAGYSSFYKLVNNRFVKQGNYNFGGRLDFIEIDPSNENNIYASRAKNLYRSTNKGINWSRVSSFQTNITSIEVHNDNSNILFVTTSGSSNGGVFKSSNQGADFTNISGNLPREGKFIVRHEKGTESIYLGTYLGVYHKNGDNAWADYSPSLPTVAVRDLEINYQDKVVIAGTYGRGIWKAPLAGSNTDDNEAPTAPTRLTADNETQTTIDLAWTGSTDNVGVTGYEVYQGDTMIATVEGTRYQAMGLLAGTEYSFKVLAMDAAGNKSRFSNTATASTLPEADTEAPTEPTGLTAGNETQTTIDVAWTGSTDNVGVTGYEVYQGDVMIATVEGTRYQVTGLTAGTEYSFKVLAMDAAGNKSRFSNTATASTLPEADTEAPTEPTGLTAGNETQTTIDLAWTGSTDNVGVTGYEVYQGDVMIATVEGTRYQVTGLTAGTEYTFKVLAMDAAGNKSRFSNTATASTLPEADTEAPTNPTGLTAGNETQTTIDLAWTGSTDNVGVTGYEVYQGDTMIATVEGTRYQAMGLLAGTEYSFKVLAMDAAGNKSRFSNTATASTLPEADTEAPTEPTGLTAGNETQTTIDLAWTESTDNVGVTGYEVYQGDTMIATVEGTRYQAIGLLAGTEYTFKVLAMDAAGNKSRFSNTATASTLTDDTVDNEAPTDPTDLTAGNETQTTIDLAWTESTDNVGVTGYEVYQGDTMIATVEGTRYQAMGLLAGTVYSFKVLAMDAAGNKSRFSNIATASTLPDDTIDTEAPTNPTELVASNIKQTSLSLTWTASTDNVGVTGYNVYQGTEMIGTTGGTETSFNVSGLTASTTYQFTVKAMDAAGNMSESSNVASATTEDEDSNNICEGVASWQWGVPYQTGDRVVYKGNLFEKLDQGWKFIGKCGASTCEGIDDWKNDAQYTVGDKVVYQGNLWERTNRGWVFASSCGAKSTSKIAPPEEIIVTPVPATTKLNISFTPNETTTFAVFDILGRIVMQGKYQSQLDVSELRVGTYILRISTSKDKYIAHFVKK
ncbi:fibronectin type III domain-containing protein [Aquimarina sp. 2201CG1-2-11]|uniref:fibronectin type III domain-containing protein n=1 Tax=Aquimarina discodermiae TaxID=3231043 RepID=UPI0034632619